MLSALEDATGSFPEAVAICERLLGARGHVYPSTLDKVQLSAETCDGVVLEGQAKACKSTTALHRAWLESDTPVRAYGPALDAIRSADLIVLGPGSLFTSIIPNLLVPGVIDAIRESSGVVAFVCSLADMQGETWGLSAREHFEALMRHGMDGLVDYVLVHSPEALRPANRADRMARAVCGDVPQAGPSAVPARPSDAIRPVRISYEDAFAIQQAGPVVLVRNLVDPLRPTWHDASALREAMRTVVRLSRLRLRK